MCNCDAFPRVDYIDTEIVSPVFASLMLGRELKADQYMLAYMDTRYVGVLNGMEMRYCRFGSYFRPLIHIFDNKYSELIKRHKMRSDIRGDIQCVLFGPLMVHSPVKYYEE